ncbi:MAG: ABC transporter substrate-binding protein [Candidatus Liptonbacteria bacterium]|nr:ABC transporter substrate-binding protein [Candidatus Liptonbacteria bacterium]
MNSSGRLVLGVVIIIAVLAGVYALLQSPETANGPAAPGQAVAQPITIGFIGPLTGDTANLGQNAKAAVEIALEEVNAAGGVNGRPLRVIYEDGRCNGKDGSDAANKLINADNVPVILGGACSGETMAFASAAEQAKRVVLSYCSSAPSVTQAGDYIFRDYPSDLLQGTFGANYAYATLGKRKVGVLYVKSDWGVGVSGVFKDTFVKLGGTVVASEGYDQAVRDLRTQITKIKAAKPDIVYFAGYTGDSIIGIKQAADLKLGVPLFGADAWDDPKVWTDVGAAGEGALFTVVSAPLSDAFKAKMKEKTGSENVIACSPGAYDGIKILAQVMAKVGTDSTAIKNELYKTEYTGGVSAAKVAFDANGDPVSASYIVKVVKDGKAAEQK